MRKPKLLAVLCGVVMMLGAQAMAAGEATRQKLLIELYDVMQYDKVLAQMNNAVSDSLEVALRQRFPQIDAGSIKVVREVAEETYAGLKPQIVKFVGAFMVQNFSEDDIRKLIEFYKTPTGQKSLALMPKMTQEMMAWLIPMTQPLQLELRAKLQERLKARGYDL